jgi:hypothetical protein
MEYFFFFAGQVPLALGLTYIFEEREYRKLYEEVESSRVMDLEHIPSVEGIPRNKPVCMRGFVQGPNRDGILPGTKDSIVSRVIPCYPGSKNNDYHFEVKVTDSLLKQFHLENSAKSETNSTQSATYLFNSMGDQILLAFPEKDLVLHNVSISQFESDSLGLLPKERLGKYSIQKGTWEYYN